MKTLAISVILGAVITTGCHIKTQNVLPYSIVKIELSIMDKIAANRRNNNSKKYYEDSDFYWRICRAGPAVIPELEVALTSKNKRHRRVAGSALEVMTRTMKWPEAYEFIIKMLYKDVYSDAVPVLLSAIAHDGIKDYPEVILVAALHLSDKKVYRVFLVNGPNNRVEMRTCDYAAYILQIISGIKFGAGPVRSSDEAVEKAKAWVEENVIHIENGKTVYLIPQRFIKKIKERRRIKGRTR